MMTRRRALQIFAAVTAAPGLGRATEMRTTLGAQVAITLDGPDSVTRPALELAWAELDRIERLFSLYADSELVRLNRTGELRDPDPDLVAILRLCDRLHTATDGHFDPTVQPLWLAHANGGDTDAARGLVGWDRVHVDNDLIRLGVGQALTLNGIAQGYATDLVAQMLMQAGLDRALVNVGEFRALGGPWRLGIEDPAFGRIGQQSLTDRATATSSPAAMRLPDGTAHIIDPTGQDAVPLWSTVTVSAETAAMADGLSTAFCHAPLTQIQTIAARLGDPLTIRLVDLSGNFRTL